MKITSVKPYPLSVPTGREVSLQEFSRPRHLRG